MTKEFSLRLANGLSWHLSATSEVQHWLEKIALVLGLEPGKSGQLPRIIIAQPDSIFSLNPRDTLVTIKQAPNEELSIANLSRVLRMIYEKTVEAEGFPLHAAMIVKNNKAFLLSARRGTGKTTCCNRIPSPWNVICDDKTLIVKTSDNKYRVHPLPTQSNFYKNKLPKKWNIQKSYQLEAVYFIEQAVKDEVVPIWQGEAAKLLYHQIKIIHSANPKNFTHKEMEKMRNYNKSVFNNACTLTQNVPCNVLRVSLHGKFWEKIRKRSRNIPSCSAN